jgi:hypothetical protein
MHAVLRLLLLLLREQQQLLLQTLALGALALPLAPLLLQLRAQRSHVLRRCGRDRNGEVEEDCNVPRLGLVIALWTAPVRPLQPPADARLAEQVPAAQRRGAVGRAVRQGLIADAAAAALGRAVVGRCRSWPRCT